MRLVSTFLLALAVTAATSGRPASDARPLPEAARSRAERGPTLLVPSPPDSVPHESEPQPLLGPGIPNPVDTTRQSPREFAEGQFQLGLTLERDNLAGAAIVAYRSALRYDPDLRDANYRMGQLFRSVGQWGEALQCFRAEVARHPDHHDAARGLGLTLAHLGEHARAVAHLESLQRARPGDGKVWHALGFAYGRASRTAEAEAALRRAIRLEPADPEEHRDLGSLLAASGRTGQARREYRRALALAPRDPTTWLNLGNLERRTGRADSALACYRRAEAGDSAFALAYRAQVEVLRERGRLDEAGRVYRRWLANRPADHGARLEAVHLFEALALGDSALVVAEEGVRLMPRSGPPRMIYGMALAGDGRLREALGQLREAQRWLGESRAERDRAEQLIAALRAGAPDSLRGLFEADSAAWAPKPAVRSQGD